MEGEGEGEGEGEDLSALGHHIDPECGGGAAAVLETAADLGLVGELAILHHEHVDGVRGHLLLGDQHLQGRVHTGKKVRNI